jgi:MoaA/NifB/PqqE/SkfB family radical SAM enzyme
MFNLEELHKIEIELTTQCQAACPMCSRNFHGLAKNPNVNKTSWTFDQFKSIITVDILRTVKVINFCGAYGDPLICKDILEICEYIKTHSNALVKIDTNGSVHNVNWWKKLAKVLPKHEVIFGIDGFNENHKKHRIGTDFDKIIENAKAFITENGTAGARFISFDHNKDDFNNLKKFLLDIGFSFVFKINSDRFRSQSFSVVDKNQKELYKLRPAPSDVMSFNDSELPSILDKAASNTVKCRSINNKEIYIDAYKHLYPCCEIAAIRYEKERLNEDNFNSILPELKKQVNQIHKDYNDMLCVDLTKISIKEVLSDKNYIKTWQGYWDLNKSFVCNIICGTIDNKKIIDKDSQLTF